MFCSKSSTIFRHLAQCQVGVFDRVSLSMKKNPMLNVPVRTAVTQRAWNVIRFHPDLKQAIKMKVKTTNLSLVRRETDILVRVMASSVNQIDLDISRGCGNALLAQYNPDTYTGIGQLTRLPKTLGRDFVGQIIQCGSAVKNYKPGDLVWGTVPPYETGTHVDYFLTTEMTMSHKPSNLSITEAAGLPYVGLSAFSALSLGELNATNSYNKKVLVVGGNGGVGCFAIQLLKYWGATVVTTCSAASIDWLHSLTNADLLIDYMDTEPFLKDYTGTFDFILDASSSKVTRHNYEMFTDMARMKAGRILNDKTMYVTLNAPLLDSSGKFGISSGSYTTLADAINDSLNGLTDGFRFRWVRFLPNPEALAQISELVEQGAVKPFTTRVVDFDRAIDAYQSLENKPHIGKVVLDYNGLNNGN